MLIILNSIAHNKISYLKVMSFSVLLAELYDLVTVAINFSFENIHLIYRHQGAAFDHECSVRLRPQQGDQLHGARPDGRSPSDQVQRRLGCQAPLDPALLPALLGGRYRTAAGSASPLKERVARQDFNAVYCNVDQLCFVQRMLQTFSGL